MFGMQTYGFQPDIASFAKGVTSGYIPLGGVALSDEIFNTMAEPDRMFMHGFTYSGHPVACAVGLRNIQIIEDEKLAANAGAMGEYLLGELQRLLGDHPNMGNIRGKGLMFMCEFAANRETKEKFDPAKNCRRQVAGGDPQARPDRALLERRHRDRAAADHHQRAVRHGRRRHRRIRQGSAGVALVISGRGQGPGQSQTSEVNDARPKTRDRDQSLRPLLLERAVIQEHDSFLGQEVVRLLR